MLYLRVTRKVDAFQVVDGWWSELIEWCVSAGLEDQLVDQVKTDLSNNLDFANENFSMARRYITIVQYSTLQLILRC